MTQQPRSERGPREVGRDVHSDLCNSPACPCFVEGYNQAAEGDGRLVRQAEQALRKRIQLRAIVMGENQ